MNRNLNVPTEDDSLEWESAEYLSTEWLLNIPASEVSGFLSGAGFDLRKGLSPVIKQAIEDNRRWAKRRAERTLIWAGLVTWCYSATSLVFKHVTLTIAALVLLTFLWVGYVAISHDRESELWAQAQMGDAGYRFNQERQTFLGDSLLAPNPRLRPSVPSAGQTRPPMAQSHKSDGGAVNKATLQFPRLKEFIKKADPVPIPSGGDGVQFAASPSYQSWNATYSNIPEPYDHNILPVRSAEAPKPPAKLDTLPRAGGSSDETSDPQIGKEEVAVDSRGPLTKAVGAGSGPPVPTAARGDSQYTAAGNLYQRRQTAFTTVKASHASTNEVESKPCGSPRQPSRKELDRLKQTTWSLTSALDSPYNHNP